MADTQLYQATSVSCSREMAAGYKHDILNYMKAFRQLKKDEDFYLEEIDEDVGMLQITHPYTYMVPYKKDIKIPFMVLKIINDDIDALERTLLGTKRELVELMFYMGNSKKLKKNMDVLLPSARLIEGLLQDPKKVDKIKESIYENHPILFCSESEYWRFINIRRESAELTEEYLRKLWEP